MVRHEPRRRSLVIEAVGALVVVAVVVVIGLASWSAWDRAAEVPPSVIGTHR